MIDLHIHTTASDGQYTPSQIAKMAKDKGVTHIAITDHDSINGLAEGAETAKQEGICFIPGIEISVKSKQELHILGYHISSCNPELLALCEEFAENRRLRGSRIIEYLRGYGITLEIEHVQKFTGGDLLGRPHFAQAMVAAGYVKTPREAFDKYLGTHEFNKVERPKPTPAEGIGIITGAGGIAVLAHPSQIGLTEIELEDMLQLLIGFGLGGIECYYSEHTPEQIELYLSLAHKYNLFVTCGSDFHGEKVKPEINLGDGYDDSFNKNEKRLTAYPHTRFHTN